MLGSAIEYADALPKDWKIDQLGNLGTFINGYAFKPINWGKNGRPIIRIQNLNDPKKPFNYFDNEIDRKYLIAPGDILISWSASLDAFLWKNGEAWLNQHIFKALPDEDQLARDFFFYAMKYAMLRIATHARGSTMRHVTAKQFKQSELAFPPLPEQRRIAAVLSLVQRAIEQQERLIALTTELKQALMHKLFAEGTRGEPQKQTEIGPIPESWEVVELGTLVREPLRNGHSAKASKDENGIRTLILTAVTQRDFSIENTKVTCADPKRVKNMWLKPGDIFVERANTAEYVGLAALYEGEENFAIFPDLLVRIRVDESKIAPKVLTEWLLDEPCRRYYKKNARSTAGNFPKIGQGTIEKTLIPVPQSDEQQELEKAFRSLDAKIAQHSQKKFSLKALFRTLLHHLMTAEIRVNNFDIEELGLYGNK